MRNRGPVTLQNDGFVATSTTWQQPTQVLTARTIKFSAQFDF